MEIVVDPMTGRVTELFNGSVLPCTRDDQCPWPGMLCADNLTWAAQQHCVCDPEHVWLGEHCDVASAASKGYMSSFLLCALVSFLAFARAVAFIATHRAMRKWNTAAATLCMSAVGSLSLCAALCCIASSFITPCTVADPATGVRFTCMYAAEAPLLGVAFFFLSLTLLNISVNWVEAAYQLNTATGRPSPGVERALYRYKVILACFYLLYSVSTVALAFLPGGLSNTATAILPPLCVCIVCYSYGWYRIRALLQRARVQQGMVPGADHRMRVLANIRRTFWMLSTMIVGTMASAVAFVAVGGEASATPFAQPSVVASCMLYWCGVVIPHAVTSYLTAHAGSKAASERHLPPKKKSGVVSGAASSENESEGAFRSKRERVMSLFHRGKASASRGLRTVVEESVGDSHHGSFGELPASPPHSLATKSVVPTVQPL